MKTVPPSWKPPKGQNHCESLREFLSHDRNPGPFPARVFPFAGPFVDITNPALRAWNRQGIVLLIGSMSSKWLSPNNQSTRPSDSGMEIAPSPAVHPFVRWNNL